MKRIVYMSALLFAVGCAEGEFRPQTGDLLFQAGAGGDAAEPADDMSEAIATATGGRGDVSFTHAAIVVVEPDGVYALEASGRHGVVMTPLDDFLARSVVRDGKPVVAVGRLRTPQRERITAAAVERAKSFMGQPYDGSFLPGNGKMYCTELVWESYRDENGAIFEARPMNFRAPDGSMPAYWIDHFEALGEEIPEGVPGTNPDDMSRDEAIEIIHRYDRPDMRGGE